MTKQVTKKMAVKCLIHMAANGEMIRCLGFEIGGPSGYNEMYYFRCVACGLAIHPEHIIQFDHRHADIHGGPHEYQNLRPLHYECHKAKTKRDVQANAKVKRIAKGGRKRKGRKMKSRPFQKKKAA